MSETDDITLVKTAELDLGYLSEDLSYLTRSIRAHIRRENAVFYKDYDVEPGEIAIINLIGINPGISQNDLAAAVVLKKSALTKIIKVLDDKGLVSRRKVKADKRYNALTLTPAGEAKREQLRQGMERQHADLLASFGAKDQQNLFRLLQQLSALLTERHLARAEKGDDDFTNGDD